MALRWASGWITTASQDSEHAMKKESPVTSHMWVTASLRDFLNANAADLLRSWAPVSLSAASHAPFQPGWDRARAIGFEPADTLSASTGVSCVRCAVLSILFPPGRRRRSCRMPIRRQDNSGYDLSDVLAQKPIHRATVGVTSAARPTSAPPPPPSPTPPPAKREGSPRRDDISTWFPRLEASLT